MVEDDGGLDIGTDDFAVISDCRQAALFRVTRMEREEGIATLVRGSGAGPFDNAAGVSLSATDTPYGSSLSPEGAAVFSVITEIYFIAGGTGRNNVGSVPASLWRKMTTDAPVELIQGIDDLQLRLGLDGDGDGAVDRYAPPGAAAGQDVLSRRGPRHGEQRRRDQWRRADAPDAFPRDRRQERAMTPGHVRRVAAAAPVGRARRDGIALFVCLVVLLALGVAGVSASQTVSLEVRMARNGHDGQLALQAAEAALREGERLVASAGFDPSAPGLYEVSGFGGLEPWSRPQTWRGGGSRVAATLEGVAEPPRLVVERITSGTDEPVFRVTARAVGGTPHAIAVLQSTFTLSAAGGDGTPGPGRAIRLSWRELEVP